MELPEVFLEQMKHLLGEEYEAFLECQKEHSERGLRVNTSKVKVEKFEEISPFPLEKIPWTGNGFYFKEVQVASGHPYYAAGLYYLQEPSAMAPAAYLPVSKGELVLDLCAAPGGKATELAARLRGTGLLVANDISNSRSKGLLKNLELFGMANILVTSEEPKRLRRYFSEFFDKILVDVSESSIHAERLAGAWSGLVCTCSERTAERSSRHAEAGRNASLLYLYLFSHGK